jgi:hypothetical protein
VVDFEHETALKKILPIVRMRSAFDFHDVTTNLRLMHTEVYDETTNH